MGEFQSFIGVDFWTAFFVLLNTIVLFLVLKKFLYKPVMRMIESRQKEIDDMYSQADDSRQNAQALKTEYEQKLAEAKQTGEDIVKEAVARGQRREEEILQKAAVDAAAMRDKAQMDIAMEKKKALNDAKNEISGLAIAIAEKVVGREINAQDQNQLVEQFIEFGIIARAQRGERDFIISCGSAEIAALLVNHTY